METESFKSAKLGHLDFKQESTSVTGIPLPDELPKRMDLSHLPKDILKSSTIENLISQNEDLMARLKVSLRRMSILETENQRLTEEANKARLSQTSISDQLLVLKEKDGMWKQKIDQLEKEKEIQGEKVKAYQQRMEYTSAELARYIKYHDRIKNQVKPYISQLKEYSKTQEIKIREIEGSLANKEAQLRDLRHQMIEVTKNSRYQVEASEKKAHEMIQFYEQQIEGLQREVQILHKVQEELEIKSIKLHAALERQDILENEVVTLRRSKDELVARFDREIQNQQERMSELIRQNQKLGVEHADLQVRVVEDSETIKKIQKENFQLTEQLESLRFMWNAKNDEHEKLKSAASALERLNLELSQKLNEMRKQEEL